MSGIEVVRRIICEKDTSQLIPSKPRDDLQKLRLSGLYELLVVLRIILTFNLQTGWIDQSEFTNSEVIAGDYFDLQVFKSPSFNASFPTKSISFLHMTIYWPYLLGCYFLYDSNVVGKEFIPNSKMMILIPRLYNLLLSFLVDYILIMICDLNSKSSTNSKTTTTTAGESEKSDQIPQTSASANANTDKSQKLDELEEESKDYTDYSIRLVTLASSQVLLVFTNRTHASNLNLILFSLLIYLVCDSLHRVNEYIPIVNEYHREKEPVKKVLLLRQMRATRFSPIQKLHWITLIIVCGLFNDPEFFLCYSVVPLFFYLQRGISNRYIGMVHFHIRIFVFLFYFFAMCIPFVLWDSLYYGRVTIDDFRNLNSNSNSNENFEILSNIFAKFRTKIVFTPVNYFAQKGFESIGGGPWSLFKTLFNFILLFNILGVMGIVSFGKELYDIIWSEWKAKPKMDSQWTFLNCSLILPIIFLSQQSSTTLFSLVPLIFLLVYMHGHKIPLVSRFNTKIGFLWFICNFVGVVFWGYFNQAGILSSLLELNSQITPLRYNPIQINIVYSQMESIPPTFVLAIPSKWKTMVKLEKSQFTSSSTSRDDFSDPSENELNPYKTVLRIEFNNKVRVYSIQAGFHQMERDLERLIQDRYTHYDQYKDLNYHFPLSKVNFLIVPHSYGVKASTEFNRIYLRHCKTYWNHFFINFWPYLENPEDQKPTKKGKIKLTDLREKMYENSGLELGLNLYRIDRIQIWQNFDGNTTAQDQFNQVFDKYFKFHDPLHSIGELVINFCAFLFMSILFLTSYLVFLT